MKKLILLLLILVNSTLVFSQKTKKVNNNKTGETYYVLKNDKSIRHGKYFHWDPNDKSKKNLETGFYKNGEKDSIWKRYSRFEDALISEGEYFNGKKEGLWKYYVEKKLMACFDANNKYFRKIIQDSVITEDTAMAGIISFIGGSAELEKYLENELKYPDYEYQLNIEGAVYISFMIDSIGNAFNHEIIKGASAGLNKEALRAIKKLPNTWIPSYFNGELNKAFRVIIPINFSISK